MFSVPITFVFIVYQKAIFKCELNAVTVQMSRGVCINFLFEEKEFVELQLL